jgi:RHS repeat-associated protein
LNGVGVVTDRLGSVRANANGERFSYFPYGEERTSTADGREKFGTYSRDPGGQDYADQRYYSSATGRFNVPDPGGMKTATLTRPSTWNRYGYTSGDPVNFFDPNGRLEQAPNPCFPYPEEIPCVGGGDPCFGSSFLDPGCIDPGPEPPPPPPPPPGAPSCSISVDYRGITGLPSIGIIGAAHGYLAVNTPDSSYVIEGYLYTEQSSPDSLPVQYLDVEKTPTGHGDDPAHDKSYGSVSGAFVCDWLPTLAAAGGRVTKDKVVYDKTGPNSNTALYYLLSQLPRTFTPWYKTPNLIGYYAYPF